MTDTPTKAVLQFHPDQLAEVKKRILRHVEEVGFNPENQGKNLHDFAIVLELNDYVKVGGSKVIPRTDLLTQVADDAVACIVQQPERFLKMPSDMFVCFEGEGKQATLSTISQIINSFTMDSKPS
jgi:hypothetical protein